MKSRACVGVSLQWALRGAVALANLGLVSQLVAIGVFAVSMGAWAPLAVIMFLPQGIVLAIVVAHLHDQDVREPIGNDARRAITRMLAALSLVIDMQMGDAGLPRIWFGGALATMVAMFAIRRTEFGLARCIVPFVVVVPVVLMIVVARDGWYFWLPIVGALLLYAVCMALLQRAGLGMRPPTPAACRDRPREVLGAIDVLAAHALTWRAKVADVLLRIGRAVAPRTDAGPAVGMRDEPEDGRGFETVGNREPGPSDDRDAAGRACDDRE